MRNAALRLGGVLVVGALASATCYAAVDAAPQPNAPKFSRYTGPTNRPDEVGGYSSSCISVQVRTGIAPGRLGDGRLSLRAKDSASGNRAEEAAAADLLTRWKAERISPTIDPPAQDVAMAASLGLDRFYIIVVPQGTDTPAMVADIGRLTGLVERAEVEAIGGLLDGAFPDPQLWALHNLGQTVNNITGLPGADLKATEAWVFATGGASVVVGVLDTGVSQSHPNTATIQVPGRSWDPNRLTNTDDDGVPSHGTECAGLVAGARIAANNYSGVAWGVKIMPLKIATAGGSINAAWPASGVVWGTDNGARVLSMSFGMGTSDSAFAQACQYAKAHGVLPVASSGNTPGGTIPYPAAWSSVICVGATDSSDQLGQFVTTGPAMDVCAPGINILCCVDEPGSPNTFRFDSGTSQAAPYVAGLAALLMSAAPAESTDRIRQIIQTTVDDLGLPGYDTGYGWGRVNAERAMRVVLNLPRCAADWNNDGAVTPADLAEFIADWSTDLAAGTVVCDFNGNGLTEPEDVSYFIQAWFAAVAGGC